jgi:hypothetical protein
MKTKTNVKAGPTDVLNAEHRWIKNVVANRNLQPPLRGLCSN